MTMISVAIGPRKSEINHQTNPRRPLAWAIPALISERVNHPIVQFPDSGILESLRISTRVNKQNRPTRDRSQRTCVFNRVCDKGTHGCFGSTPMSFSHLPWGDGPDGCHRNSVYEGK